MVNSIFPGQIILFWNKIMVRIFQCIVSYLPIYRKGFRMLAREEEIQNGWRLASLNDVTKHEEEAREAINIEWGICTLVDGQIKGPGYKFEVEKGSFFDLGHKLATNKGSGMLLTNNI